MRQGRGNERRLSTGCAHRAAISAEAAVKKILFVIGVALVMAGCSEAPTAPAARRASPARPSFDDITCRSGYVVAYDENGNPYCAPAPDGTITSGQAASPSPAASSPSRPHP